MIQSQLTNTTKIRKTQILRVRNVGFKSGTTIKKNTIHAKTIFK